MANRNKPAAGLHRTILVSVVLLLAAALLFAGFLLLNLTERQLLEQRIGAVTDTMTVVAQALSLQSSLEPAAVESLLQSASGAPAVEGWTLFDRDLHLLGGTATFSPQGHSDLTLVRLSREPILRSEYRSASLFFEPTAAPFVRATVPLVCRGEFAGALQARFPLAEVQQRVREARALALIYVVLYGAVLALFGVWLLDRAVVRPVRRLSETSRQVAGGHLDQAIPEGGPAEIADLSRAFNGMLAALQQSRAETEAHITSLQQANTDLQQTRDELIRSEKMASVGHLAAGMAHEIGNPLGALVGYLGVLQGELALGRQQEITTRCLAESGRIDRLVRDLLDYAAPGRGEVETLDSAAVLREAAVILTHQGALSGNLIDDALPADLPVVRIVRHKLLQVCVNLLLNARDASRDGEAIRLEGGVEGVLVRLAVVDAGAGIDAAVLPNVFDPFFTTKSPGEGRGLGLFVCHRIIEEAGGRIEARSDQGIGSTFVIRLPRAGGKDGI